MLSVASKVVKLHAIAVTDSREGRPAGFFGPQGSGCFHTICIGPGTSAAFGGLAIGGLFTFKYFFLNVRP